MSLSLAVLDTAHGGVTGRFNMRPVVGVPTASARQDSFHTIKLEHMLPGRGITLTATLLPRQAMARNVVKTLGRRGRGPGGLPGELHGSPAYPTGSWDLAKSYMRTKSLLA